jgi:hypothetical protein
VIPDQKLQKLVLGHVRSNAERRAAEVAAGGTAGVEAVIDDLLVELPGRVQSENEAIAGRCVAHLAADRATDLGRVRAARTFFRAADRLHV